MTTNICVWYCYDSDIWMDYPKLISEKWNLTAKFNCLDGHYLMCHLHYVSLCVDNANFKQYKFYNLNFFFLKLQT